ncbi:MAG: hypothetical protein JWQ49_4337 [Edaphobacter sp.]|nr:hypothetical protein [Edaphobacter sp.]
MIDLTDSELAAALGCLLFFAVLLSLPVLKRARALARIKKSLRNPFWSVAAAFDRQKRRD